MNLKRFVNKYFSREVIALPLLTASATLLLEYFLLVLTPSEIWMLPSTALLMAAVLYINLHWSDVEETVEEKVDKK